MQVLGNGVPGAVGQGRRALFPGLEVAKVASRKQKEPAEISAGL